MKYKIELYTTSSCQNCKIAKMILEQYELKYIEKNIEIDKNFEKEFDELTQGQRYIPTLVFNENVYINIKPHELFLLVQKIKSLNL